MTKSDLLQVAILCGENAGSCQAVAELLPSMPRVTRAARFLGVCGDSRRIRRICELRGIPFANDHLDAFLNATTDAAPVLQNLIRAASAAGAWACPISVIRNHAMRIAERLALPDYVFPLARLCLVWPSREGFVSLRLHMALTVHVDRYGDTNFGAEIDGYDRRRDARHSIPENDWRQSGVSASHRSMAGRRTRLVRSRCLKGRISEHSSAARVSSWTSEEGGLMIGYLNPDQRIAPR